MIIVPPLGVIPVVDQKGYMTASFRAFTTQVAKTAIMSGSGSPEGVVSAESTQEYMDTAGIAGAIKYIKQVDHVGGDTTLGWILI